MKKILTFVAVIAACASMTVSAQTVHSYYQGTKEFPQGVATPISFNSTYKPEVIAGNGKVAEVKYWYQSGQKYFYKLKATGDIGSSTGIYAGTKTSKDLAFVAKVAHPSYHTGAVSAAQTIELKDGLAGFTGSSYRFTPSVPVGATLSVANPTLGYVDNISESAYAYFPNTVDGQINTVNMTVNGKTTVLFHVKHATVVHENYTKTTREFSAELLTLINAHRATAGEAAAHEADYLNKAADVRAQELAQSYSHKRPNGENGPTTNDLVNTFSDHYVYDTSEIIVGPVSVESRPQNAFNMWKNSQGHELVMRSGYATNYGASYFTTPDGLRYMVALFSAN